MPRLEAEYFEDDKGRKSLARVLMNRAFYVYSLVMGIVTYNAVHAGTDTSYYVLKDMASNFLLYFAGVYVGGKLADGVMALANKPAAVEAPKVSVDAGSSGANIST